MAGGDLRQVPYPVVLYAYAHEKRSGVLKLKRQQLEKQIIFEEGVPVDCRSNLATETLGRFLVAQNKLPADKLAQFLSESYSRQVPLGELLIEHGVLTPYELFRTLQQNLARKLLDGFGWHDGEFGLSLDVPQVGSPLKVRVPQLVITGVMKFARQAEIDASVGPLIGRTLGLHPDPGFSIDEIRLAPKHAAVLEALKKRARIDQIADATQLPFEDITRLLYALAILGAAVPAEQIPKTAPPQQQPPPPPKPAPPQPAVAPAPRPAQSIDALRNDVMRVYLDYRRKDPFDLFGLADDATPLQINAAYLAFAKRFAPWPFGEDDELRALAEKAEEMFLAAAKAYALLSDPDERRSLASQRRTKAQARQAAPQQFTIKTDLLDPDVQYRKGIELKEQGKLREALTQFEFASDCDSQSGIYRAEAAYCRYLMSPFIPTGRKSLEELQEAIRIEPECGLAYFYAGEIHRALGDRANAEKNLRAANKLMAPDRRPIEALKALGVS